MKKTIEFIGIDKWNRPVFKTVGELSYYGSTNTLFKCDATEEEVLEKITVGEIEYFGNYFGCEPIGGRLAGLELEIKSKFVANIA